MSRIDAMNGNACVAKAVQLCEPDVIAAYPITPQSSVVEKLAAMAANGRLCSKIVDVESEHSSMSVVRGAAMVGKRVFTATAGQGLAYMYEPYYSMATMRLPMVMAIACREMISPGTVWSGLQDALSVRDAGWIQIFVEDNQEILDMIIQGYKIAEHPDVQIPVNICYDGFYLSHQTKRVDVPDKDEVDAFLPTFNGRQWLDVDNPGAMDPNTLGAPLMKYRENHLQAMQTALKVIECVNTEFAAAFGRDYGGLIEVSGDAGAKLALVTMGGTTGAARVAVENAARRGIPVRLVKVRAIRPFPTAALVKALEGAETVGVADKSVSFGCNTGVLYQEMAAALGRKGVACQTIPFIGGLGGFDVRTEYLDSAIDMIAEANKTGQTPDFPVWLDERMLGEGK